MNEEDPVVRLAIQRAIVESADIEAQLRGDIRGGRPVISLLVRARDEAAIAVRTLVFEDDLTKVPGLQTVIRRYDDLIRWVREIIEAGFEADDLITQADRDEIQSLLIENPDLHEANQLDTKEGPA